MRRNPRGPEEALRRLGERRGERRVTTEGYGELNTPAAGSIALLANPYVAALAGLGLGVVMLLVSRLSVRFMTPEDAALGLAKVAVSMLLRMGLVIAALAAYFFWARPGLVPFGAALSAGFFVMVTVELFRTSRHAMAGEGGRQL